LPVIFHVGCTESIYGTYVLSSSENSMDTLILRDNNTYEHIVYALTDTIHEYYRQINLYDYQNSRLFLHGFYLNEDEKVFTEFKCFEDILMDCSFPVSRRNGKIRIGVRENLVYHKIN